MIQEKLLEDTDEKTGTAPASRVEQIVVPSFNSSFLAGDSERAREPNDFYKTPEWATRLLLDREDFPGVIWEPACGDGAISCLLPGPVISTDLHDRGYGETGVDFLGKIRKVNHVVTNPPYALAQAFVEHALKCADSKVAMLLKLNFLAGQRRKPFFGATPLRTVFWLIRGSKS